MAIYSNYGKYIKAKKFKEAVETNGLYMLLGIGYPSWGNDNQIPISPFNSTVLTDNITNNQFKDSHINLYTNDVDGNLITHLEDGSVNSPSVSDNDSFISRYKDIMPPFPGVWKYNTSDESTELFNGVSLSNFKYHYIKSYPNGMKLDDTTEVQLPDNLPENSIKRQVFSEMYLRGLNRLIKNPVGLLGAIKCDISFVKDIGSESDNIYTGSDSQFWYGDRYWEICNVDELVSTNNVSPFDSTVVNFPHHLLVTAMLNPRYLCATFSIDQSIIPGQIAIFAKKSPGDLYYRVGENIFNFGQYSASELNSIDSNVLNSLGKPSESLIDKRTNRILNFTLADDKFPSGEFEFILNDYIKGSPRQQHMVDRIGYIIGF